MPLFHIGGSGWATVAHFIGARLEILREIDFGELVRLFSTGGVTHAFVVPAVLQFMQLVPGVGDADFSSLEVIVYGASPISEEVLAASIKLLGCGFFQVYGLTETTGAITHLPPADHDLAGPTRHRLRSCGLPGPGVELRIVDVATGADVVEPDVPGEILVRGQQVMKGYWNNPEATREAIDEDGWFRTGDVGYLDADGYLYIHDRVKDMIVSGGENIYPAEVENVLMSHPAIADVAVIGVPSEKWGETPKAIVVLAARRRRPTRPSIIAFARERLATYKCPTSVDFTDALPRNPSGKILKKDLRAPYWEGRRATGQLGDGTTVRWTGRGFPGGGCWLITALGAAWRLGLPVRRQGRPAVAAQRLALLLDPGRAQLRGPLVRGRPHRPARRRARDADVAVPHAVEPRRRRLRVPAALGDDAARHRHGVRHRPDRSPPRRRARGRRRRADRPASPPPSPPSTRTCGSTTRW